MSNLTKKQRDELPLDSFGDPDNRLFPIKDQDDVDSAAHLIGKAKNPEKVKARIIRIAKKLGLKIPDAWQSDAKHTAFTADLSHFGETGGMVLRRGKIFEAGDYPDKAYSMTPEELLAAVADFAPVPLDLEHTPTVLDGKLGELRAVELGDDAWSLYGTVALPQWLDEQLGGECKVSCTWDRNAKRVTKLALVNNPRVPDAAIMAAFAAAQGRHDTADGQFTLQMIHDMAARAGAICDQGNASRSPGDVLPTTFNSRHEADAMQSIHDHAAAHGASCSAINQDAARMALTTAAFVAKRHSAADAKDIQQMHDLTVKQGAQCADPDGDADDQPKGAGMSDQKPSRMDRFMKWLNGESESIEFTESKQEAQTTPQPDAEKEQMKAQLAELRAERTREKAVAFAEGEIRAGRALPAERAAIIAQYVQAASDDAAHGGVVTFADNQTTGTRVEALAALFAARVPHQLTGARLPLTDKAVQALQNPQETRFMTDSEGRITKEGLVELANLLPEHEREDVAARIEKRFSQNGK